jgi:uncharacterized protein (DUF697 family)
MTATAENPAGDIVYDRLDQAGMVVKDYVTYSMGAGLIPVPVVDLLGLIGIQVKMVHSLSKLYDVPFSEKRVKSLLYSMLGGVAPVVGVGLLSSIVKLVPIVGQAAGSLSMAVLAGGSTYAVGNYFVKHFEEDGSLEDVNVEDAKEDIKSNLNDAKAKAEDIKKKA